MRSAARRASIGSIAVLAVALATASGAAAGAPTAQQLNPQPPDFYTCTPNGAGTVCTAHTEDSYGPDGLGIFCTGTVGTYEVQDTGSRFVDATRWYDTAGNLVKRIRVFTFPGAHLTNPLTGSVVAYRQRDRDVDILAIPGDLDSRTTYSTGSILAVVPGRGAVIVERGRTVLDAEGNAISTTGRRDFVRYFEGDPSALSALCAALNS